MIALINTTALGLEFLKPEIERAFGQKCILQKREFRVAGRQVPAFAVTEKFKGDGKVLVVVDFDIGAPGLNFVFGQADLRNKVAVLSIVRLGENRGRILKEAKHELGHLFFLSHCKPPCVMAFSNSVFDVDEKSHQFCGLCAAKIQQQ